MPVWAFIAIYQLQPEDVRNNADPVFAVIHPDDLQRVMTSIRVSAVNLTPWQCEPCAFRQWRGALAQRPGQP